MHTNLSMHIVHGPARHAAMQVGKAVGSEGLVAGQVVDIKSEGAGDSVGIETLQVRPACMACVYACVHCMNYMALNDVI